MNKLGLFSIVVLLIVAGFLGYVLINKNNTPNQLSVSSKSSSLQTQTQDQDNVVVEVTPTTLSKEKEAVFQVSVNTHSVELSYDLSQISELSDDQGVIYKPVSWTGGSGGHHLDGVLTFTKLSESTKSIRLTIKGIASKDRVFNWNLL